MKSYPPLPEKNLLTPILLWEEGSHTQFCMENNLGTVGVILSLSRAVRSKSIQEQSVSMIHLESLFKCPVGLFHHLRTLGLYAVCSFHLMFKVLLTCCTKSATKAGPLPDPVLVGNPNLGTISLSRHQATSDALSVQVGKAFTHLKNAHTLTSR